MMDHDGELELDKEIALDKEIELAIDTGLACENMFNIKKKITDKIKALKLIEENPWNIRRFSKNLQCDFDIGLAAAQKDGCIIEILPPKLRNNPVIVMAAIHNYGRAIQYAPIKFQNDPEFALAAILQNSVWFHCLLDKFQKDKTFLSVHFQQTQPKLFN